MSSHLANVTFTNNLSTQTLFQFIRTSSLWKVFHFIQKAFSHLGPSGCSPSVWTANYYCFLLNINDVQKNSLCNSCVTTTHLFTCPVPWMISPPSTPPGVTEFCYAYNACMIPTRDSSALLWKCIHIVLYLTATQVLHTDYPCNTLLPTRQFHLWHCILNKVQSEVLLQMTWKPECCSTMDSCL